MSGSLQYRCCNYNRKKLYSTGQKAFANRFILDATFNPDPIFLSASFKTAVSITIDTCKKLYSYIVI